MRVLARPAFKDRKNNPYTWLLNQKMVEIGIEIDEFSVRRCLPEKYDVFHVHWPEWYLGNTGILEAIAKTISLLLLIALMRVKGTKIIWTVHNLTTHQTLYPIIETWFWKIFTHQLDGYISLSETGKKAARQVYPALRNIPGFVIPHNHYREVYPNNLSSQEARNELGISASVRVLLFFGRIKPYKNVPALIEAFAKVTDFNTVLHIAGSFSSNFSALTEEVKTMAASSSRIELHGEFIPEEKIQLYFQAADLVIVPFREILNSGSAILALSFDRPIMVPQLGSLGELQKQVGKEWIFTYEDDITPSKIEEALDWAINTPRSDKAPVDNFDLKVIARQTIDAYQNVCFQKSRVFSTRD